MSVRFWLSSEPMERHSSAKDRTEFSFEPVVLCGRFDGHGHGELAALVERPESVDSDA
jgi:hypothetical protein